MPSLPNVFQQCSPRPEELGQIDQDSKFREFAARLSDLLDRGQRVIVFTQYLDTLDFIRDQLIARYGSRIACYSGRGGEVWDAAQNSWRVVDKAEVKARCKRSHARPSTSCWAPTPRRRG